ncbi:DUF5110 domain-containing protein [Enterococcus sp. DIV0086]|uniref:DUF5110 domain-containing protein n=1 Tax=Enterococcus sp. DIV0086 TaxID=2774655 RepID=UPI003D2B737C
MIYPSQEANTFIEYEDDGFSNEFENGNNLITEITQQETDDKVVVNLNPSKGKGYANLVENRETIIEVFLSVTPKRVRFNEKEISNWEFIDKYLFTFAAENSGSSFSKQIINCGKFVKITLPRTSIFTNITIEIVK